MEDNSKSQETKKLPERESAAVGPAQTLPGNYAEKKTHRLNLLPEKSVPSNKITQTTYL